MYQSQVRSNTGRKLTVQQSTQQLDRNFLSLSRQRSFLSTNRKIRWSAVAALTACAGAALSGCGGLTYTPGSLSGASGSTTPAALSQVSCGTQSLTGPQTKGCSVYLSASATSPTTVSLKSNNPALTVPSAVTVLAGAKTTGFNAVSSEVNKSLTVTIAASSGGVTKTDAITLYPSSTAASAAVLSKVSCGTETLIGPTTKACSVYLSSAATGPTAVELRTDSANLQVPTSVSVAAGATTAGFSATASAVTSTQTVTITATAGGVSQTDAIQLAASGSPTPVQHKVALTWSAPSVTTEAIAGYRVYRRIAGASGYSSLTSSLDKQPSYTDTAVQSGATYDYVVTSVDTVGKESAPSNKTEVTIP